ncbi:MAG: aldose epimerase family protein [Bacteroidales bacterium]
MKKIKTFIRIYVLVLLALGLVNCDQSSGYQYAEGVKHPDPKDFNAVFNGKDVKLFTLVNENGLRADITNYGGRIVALLVPDKNGVFDDVVTGFHSFDEYLNSSELYFGALIGRYANRIANGRFILEGTEYDLDTNNGPNHLHGGPGGFHNVVWDAEQIDPQTLKLTYLSPDMEEGYPGDLKVTVHYTLTHNNELKIDYHAVTDQVTVLNLTNHAFFNLAGEGNKTINDHELKISAVYYTPVNENLIPKGNLEPVSGTPFDFTYCTPIGERLDADHEQMQFGKGYDHNFVLNKSKGATDPEFAAFVVEPTSGRKMEVFTTEPGLQFYGGNFLDGTNTGKRGESYEHRTSFCLETQHFPDSPNQPSFPSTVLRPGEEYRSTTIYRFSIEDSN